MKELREMLAKFNQFKRLIEDVKYGRGKTQKDLKSAKSAVFQDAFQTINNLQFKEKNPQNKNKLGALFLQVGKINDLKYPFDLDQLNQEVEKAIQLAQ